MIASKLFKACQQRGLTSALSASQTAFYKAPVRFFAKKEDKEAEEPAAAEPEVEAAEPAPEAKPEPKPKAAPKAEAKPVQAAAAPEAPLDKSLFTPFSVGNINKIESTPGDKPPLEEDTIEGRYSGVLFTTASQQNNLYAVYEDMVFLQGIYKNSETFRLFTENGGVGSNEIAKLNVALKETASFSETTFHFLTVLADNKRLNFINEIAEKYIKLYQAENKEEKITIISAATLTSEQQSQVVAALAANPQNEGKQFTIDYEVDEAILGGL